MQFYKILFLLAFLLVNLSISLGQEMGIDQPEENWLKSYGIYPEERMYFRYDRYSRDDLVKLKFKLDLLKTSNFETEWEGIYSDIYDTVNNSKIRLAFDKGYTHTNVYTCLPEFRYFSFGQVENRSDSVVLIPEFRSGPLMGLKKENYIKVKWGDVFLLVEEASLLAFSEKSAGVFPENVESGDRFKWANFWYMGDFEIPLQGLPQFPAKFKYLERSPIQADLSWVGKRATQKDVQSGDTYHNGERAIYTVALNKGFKQGVKKGVTFRLSQTLETVTITRVNRHSAIGIIVRDLGENREDSCRDINWNHVSCVSIKPKMKLSTVTGLLYF